MVVVGSGTERWNQVHMEHFDRVALTLEPGEVETVGERRGQGKTEERKKKKDKRRGREGRMRCLRDGN